MKEVSNIQMLFVQRSSPFEPTEIMIFCILGFCCTIFLIFSIHWWFTVGNKPVKFESTTHLIK